MLLSIAFYLVGMIANTLGTIGAVIKFALPSWFIEGITNIMHGAGWLNTILPIYPHAGYGGLAGEIGIITIFGWLLTVTSAIVLISLVYYAIKLLVSVLPWSTNSVDAPHNV